MKFTIDNINCIIPGCNNKVDSIEFNNMHKSKNFCHNHSNNGVEVKCIICNKILIKKPYVFIKNKKENKDFICASCSGAKNLVKFRNTSEGKLHQKNIANKNAEKWRNSEKGKEFAKNLGIKNCINLINYTRSEIGREKIRERIIKYNKTPKAMADIKALGLKTGTINITKYNKSEIHKQEVRTRINNKVKIIKNLNIFIQEKEELNITNYFSFKKYDNVPGVWSIFGEGLDGIKICLEVCQTQDIGKEMLRGIRLLSEGKNNKDKTNEEIKQSRILYNSDDSNRRIKYRNIVEYKNIIFVIIDINIKTKKERESIEGIYAIKNDAKYWKPTVSQIYTMEV